MGELLAVDRRIDGERRLGRHVFLPLDIAHHVIKLVGGAGRELFNRFQNPQGRAAAEVGLVHQLEVALEAHHAATYLHVLGAEAQQLVAQHVLKTLIGLGHH